MSTLDIIMFLTVGWVIIGSLNFFWIVTRFNEKGVKRYEYSSQISLFQFFLFCIIGGVLTIIWLLVTNKHLYKNDKNL